MSDLGWLLLWMAVAGYVAAGLVALLAGFVSYALCVTWRRLRPRRVR